MAGQEKIRINKVLKEFNIGLGTLVEFLSKKGYEVEAHPSAQISGEEYELLKKEYAKDQRIKEESAKISIKIKEITKKDTQKQEPEEEPFEDEVIIKTTTIDHPSTPEPANTEKKADPAPVKEDDDTPRPEPEPAPRAQETAAPVKEEKAPEEPKTKPEKAVADKGSDHVGPRILGKIDLNKKPSKPQSQPQPAPAKVNPAKETAQDKGKGRNEDKRPERHEVEHIETKVEKLAGPVISGKIDLSAFEKKHSSGNDRNGHRKRERIKGQGEKVAPMVPCVGEYEGLSEVDADEEQRHPEHEDVERDGERGYAFQPRTVDGHDVDGVGNGGCQDEKYADETQRGAVLPFVQQPYPAKGEGDAGDGERRDAFVEHERHDEGHEYGVNEKQGGGDTRCHVVVTLKKREGGDGDKQSHGNHGKNLLALQLETPPPRLDHDGEDGDGEKVAEEEDGVGVHARLVKGQGEKGVHPVCGGRDGPDDVSLCFRVHFSLFL